MALFEASNGDVLANLEHPLLTRAFYGLATGRDGQCAQRVHVRRGVREERLPDGGGEVREVVVIGDEIGFAVDLDDHRLSRALGDDHGAFGRDSAGLLGGLGGTRLAQVFQRGFEITAGSHQRVLAFHHACAGTLS